MTTRRPDAPARAAGGTEAGAGQLAHARPARATRVTEPGRAAWSELVRPRPLRRGGVIGLCSPAGPIDADEIAWGIAWLRDAGFEVRCAPHLHDRRGYLAGSDADRYGDLVGLLRDPAVDAILATRGGYGCGRFIDRLPADELRRTRKLVIGHSDTTALACYQLVNAGLGSIHGPMLQRDDLTAAAREHLLAMACGEPAALAPLRGESVRGGVADGPLVGGNLTLLCASLGTGWEIQTEGAVLFIEDIAVQPYAIDRALWQLRAGGKLAAASGVAVGQFVHATSPRYPEVTARDVLIAELSDALVGPIVVDLPFGHVADNWAVPFGARVRLDGDAGALTPLEAAVE